MKTTKKSRRSVQARFFIGFLAMCISGFLALVLTDYPWNFAGFIIMIFGVILVILMVIRVGADYEKEPADVVTFPPPQEMPPAHP